MNRIRYDLASLQLVNKYKFGGLSSCLVFLTTATVAVVGSSYRLVRRFGVSVVLPTTNLKWFLRIKHRNQSLKLHFILHILLVPKIQDSLWLTRIGAVSPSAQTPELSRLTTLIHFGVPPPEASVIGHGRWDIVGRTNFHQHLKLNDCSIRLKWMI